MKLIDKFALVAEIDRRLDELYELLPNAGKVERGTISISEACNTGKYTALESFKDFLDTLEVKEVDLYEELDAYFAQFKGLEKSYWNWRIDSINVHAQGIYDFARHFFELGKKQS